MMRGIFSAEEANSMLSTLSFIASFSDGHASSLRHYVRRLADSNDPLQTRLYVKAIVLAGEYEMNKHEALALRSLLAENLPRIVQEPDKRTRYFDVSPSGQLAEVSEEQYRLKHPDDSDIKLDETVKSAGNYVPIDDYEYDVDDEWRYDGYDYCTRINSD